MHNQSRLFSLTNNERKYFNTHSFIFLVFFSKENENIFELGIYSLIIY